MTFRRRLLSSPRSASAALAQVLAEVRGGAGGAAVAEDEDEMARLPGLVDQVGEPTDFRQIDALQLGLEPIQIAVNVNRVA